MIKFTQIIKNKAYVLFFECMCLLAWLSFTVQSTSSHKMLVVPYFVVGMLSVFGMQSKPDKEMEKRERRTLFALAIFFSVLVLLANHSVFIKSDGRFNPASFVCFLFSGIPVFYNALSVSYSKFCRLSFVNKCESYSVGKREFLHFLVPFGIILTVDLIYLFFAAYPGVLTPDSMWQIDQLLGGSYSNHHPFYHTMLIKVFYTLGFWLFGNANAAIATYCVFQIIVMSAIFSFALYTLHQMRVKKGIILLVLLGYTLLPYNYIYASTVWKDILFGGFCALLVTLLFRLRKEIGSKPLNYILFTVASFGVCLFRSNGLFAFVILFIALAILFYKSNKIIPIISLAVIAFSVILKGPVLSSLNVAPPDTVESLSIPLQQIARTVHDGGNLNEEEIQYIETIFGMEATSELYLDFLSDPIKNLARAKGTDPIIRENKLYFFKIWLSIGIKNPGKYILAWVDQTKGYWNAGYEYWIVCEGVEENAVGLYSKFNSGPVLTVSRALSNWLTSGRVFSLFASIGFLTWIYLAIFFFSIMKKRTGFIEAILGISIIISLCIATPVFCEFRYAYGIYTMFPLTFIFSVADKSEFSSLKTVTK